MNAPYYIGLVLGTLIGVLLMFPVIADMGWWAALYGFGLALCILGAIALPHNQ